MTIEEIKSIRCGMPFLDTQTKEMFVFVSNKVRHKKSTVEFRMSRSLKDKQRYQITLSTHDLYTPVIYSMISNVESENLKQIIEEEKIDTPTIEEIYHPLMDEPSNLQEATHKLIEIDQSTIKPKPYVKSFNELFNLEELEKNIPEQLKKDWTDWMKDLTMNECNLKYEWYVNGFNEALKQMGYDK